ncbi:hypothetical protein EsH8_X_000239 [Colletotrichum jinshuiense]
MFIPGMVQALIAALTFGIVIQGASTAVFPFAKGHGSKIFRDGLRLVLITFLVSSALWAQVDFTALTLDPTSTSGCQVAVIFTAIFDQLARFAIEQFLLWAINANSEAPTGALVYQAVLGVRFVLGAVFVGFQRAQIATVCVARNDAVAIGAAVTATDFVIIILLAFRANSVGTVGEPKRGQAGPRSKKAIVWTIGALALWTATSVPMLLGISTIDLIFRTALPGTGLSILIAIITAFAGSLLPPRAQQAVHPDAQSPRNISSSRDLSSSDTDYPPSRYEDLKDVTIETVTSYGQPREAPRPDIMGSAGGALPIIAGSVPGQAATGVGGLPVQGQLFPPPRAQTAPTSEGRRVDNKVGILGQRSIFERIGPKPNMKNAISGPILQADGEQNPLNKIATIDLATAAKNDRERRDNDMQIMQQSSGFNAYRPAPKPPAITPEDALQRAQSVRRKELGPTSPPGVPQPFVSSGLMSNPPATTTSAQLSPGVEELRRRSPRQMPESPQQTGTGIPITPGKNASPPRPPRPERPMSSFETMERSMSQKSIDRSMSPTSTTTAAQSMPSPTALVPPPPPKSAARMFSPKKPDLPSTWPIQTAVDPTIRPSRQRPPSPKTPGGSLQRRPTTGLPSNPRAMTMRAIPKDASVPQEQTVMFVNSIQYNDPTGVQNIIQGAAKQGSKDALPPQSPVAPALKSSGSVVHRPRPIPRQQGKDRQIFPAENSPNHRRSKSGGSILSRKSILMSNPGSPTQLPPLPPPPKSAGGNPVRALPNDTKSMTFDEKMNLFFPGSLNSSTPGAQPGLSIPEMPVLPTAYKPVINPANEEGDAESSQGKHGQSDRSTKSSIRTQSILEIDDAPRPDLPRYTSKFSVDTSIVTGRPEEHDSWIPALPVNDGIGSKRSYDGAKRQSSPVLPIRVPSMSEFSDTRTRDEETTTNWGSIHSPVAPVQIQEVTQMPKPTWIQPRDDRNMRDLSMISHSDGKEVMTIMLDASVEHKRDVQSPSSLGGPVDISGMGVVNQGAHWHRRIGDESITFSERKEKVNSRRMPAPMPLKLRSPAMKNTVVMQVAEPSPLESPQQAYEMIQAQLKKLEAPGRDSYQSQGQKIRLLESLEAEMGQQENQWHEMQHGLRRDSLSTVGTVSVRNSQHESAIGNSQGAASIDDALQEFPLRNNIAVDRRASRRARMQSISSLNKSSFEDLKSGSTLSAEGDNRTSMWQQRLADAQMEYMENTSELLAKRNLNFLSVSKAPRSAAQLGSPTPPDTDESDGGDAQIFATLMPNERAAPSEGLWKHTSPVYFEREPTLLWAQAHDVATKHSPSGDGASLPGLSVRPAARKTSEPLVLESSQLWEPDHTFAKKQRNSITSGLWRASWVSKSPKARETPKAPESPVSPKSQPRPLTQRPPRRNKRVTLLPDILESPKPLPDKRGTLGIFQFPWGEKSDVATVQPRPSHMLMAMPGTMSTGGSAIRAALEARAKQVEAQEYSSSFFDEYDEEEDIDDEVSDIEQDDESDDGFDETTLWEIASLLKSDQVPSKNSLLPQATMYRPESFVEEAPADERMPLEEEETKHDSMVISVAVEDLPPQPKQSSLLWTSKPKAFASTRKTTGLPQPDARTWGSYIEPVDAAPRVQVRLPDPPTIYSTALWSPPTKMAVPKTSSGPMWSKPQQRPAQKMWAARPAVVYTESMGLFNPSHKRACFRTTSADPVGLGMPSAARVTEEELPLLKSTSLWTPSRVSPRVRDWVRNSALGSKPQQRSIQKMWTARPAVVYTESNGLFDPSHKRACFKTTPADPVGLGMPSAARVTEEDLPKLASTSLWTPSRVRDWVSSSALWSKPRQSSTQKLWAARPAVVYTESNGLFNPSHKRAYFRTTPAEPVGLGMPSAARVTEEELPQLTSTSLWAPSQTASAVHDWMSFSSVRPNTPVEIASSGRSTPSLDTASTRSDDEEAVSDFDPLPEIPVKESTWWDAPESKTLAPTETTSRSPLRRTAATLEEWEAALEEARGLIPSPRFVRAEATPAEWAEALNQAVASSLDVAKCHPAFAGSVTTTAACDPAVANPMFFSPVDQSVDEEQRAHSAPATHIPLWSAPVVTVPKDTGIMWIPPTKARRHAYDTTPLMPEDAESRQLRLKRSKSDPAVVGIVNFDGQTMWSSFYGAELRRVVPLGGGNDWLEGVTDSLTSKDVFQY